MANYKKNLKLAKKELGKDEKLVEWVFGAYECERFGTDSVRNGVLIATNKRILFYGKKMFGYDMESFPLENISSIELSKGMTGHKISFFASGNKVKMKFINKGNIESFIEYAKKSIGKNNDKESNNNDDIPTKIKKLAELEEQGIITEEEFENKKTELLSQM